jgi:hypothetical protein
MAKVARRFARQTLQLRDHFFVFYRKRASFLKSPCVMILSYFRVFILSECKPCEFLRYSMPLCPEDARPEPHLPMIDCPYAIHFGFAL